jgi:hypothetical protein
VIFRTIWSESSAIVVGRVRNKWQRDGGIQRERLGGRRNGAGRDNPRRKQTAEADREFQIS